MQQKKKRRKPESKTTNDRNLKKRGTTEAQTNKGGKTGAEVFTMGLLMRLGKY